MFIAMDPPKRRAAQDGEHDGAETTAYREPIISQRAKAAIPRRCQIGVEFDWVDKV